MPWVWASMVPRTSWMGETPLNGRPLTLVCTSGHAAQPERVCIRNGSWRVDMTSLPPGATLRYVAPIRKRKSLPDLVTVQSACSLGESADSTASLVPNASWCWATKSFRLP